MNKNGESRSRRMTDGDIRRIVRDLDLWALGEKNGELSWAAVEEMSGFTRQALNARPEIKAAFGVAKEALRTGGAGKAKQEALGDNALLLNENARLKAEIAAYAARETAWKARWQRIAFNLRLNNRQVSHIDRPAPDGVKLPSERETDSILRPFDKEIPSSGRT
ncbi:protein kinase [Pseudomonas sp.]|uniref:protein kinase n=1 Tax=Pseudomonas sp. TaxID=306 RepID=UPI0025E2A1A2|nr:protein kinase [Pseudomonas sp.]